MDFGLGLVLSFTDNATAGINNAVNSLSQLTSVAEGASTSLNQMASLSALSVVADRLGSSFLSAGQTILSTLGQVVSKINDVGSTVFYAENKLGKLYEGTGKTGKDVMGEIATYAQQSIFEYEDLIDVVAMLKANGIEAFDDIASSTGNSNQKLMDYAADLAAFNPQMKNAYGTGIKAAMGALNEYIAEGNAMSLKRGASLDITGLLGEDKGATMEERSRQVADLMEKLNLVGMTASMAGTPMQRLSNVQDMIFTTISRIADSDVYEKFTNIIAKVTDWIFNLNEAEEGQVSIIDRLVPVIADTITSIMTPIEKFIDKVLELGQGLAELLANNPALLKMGTILVAIGGVLAVVIGVVLKVTSAFSGLSLMMLSMGKTFGSIGGLIKTGMLKIMSTLIPLTATIGLMYLAWKNDFAGIRTNVTYFVSNLANSFNTARNAVNGSVEDLKTTLAKLNSKNDFFSNLTIGLMKVMTLFKALGEGWNDYTLSEDTFLKAKELGILPLIEAILDLKYRFDFFKQGFIDGWKEIGEKVKTAVMGFLDNIDGTFLGDMVDNLTEFLQKLASGDTQAWYDFGQSFADFTAKAIAFWATFKIIGSVLGKLAKVVSFFVGIKNVISAVWGFIKSLQIVSFVAKIIEVIQLVAGGAGTLSEALMAVFGTVGTITAGIASVIGGAILAVTNFFSMLKNGFSWLKEILMVVGIALAAVGAIILGAPALVAGIIAGIVALVATLVVVIKEHWQQICDFFSTIGQWIYDNVIKPVADFFVGLWNGIVTGVTTAINAVKTFFSTIAQWIFNNVIQPVVNFFMTYIYPFIEKIVEIVMKVVEIITVLVGVFVQWINTNVIQPIIQFFVGLWNTIVTGVTSFIEGVKTVIGTIVEWISTNIITPIAEFFSGLWTSITTGISSFIEGAKEVFNSLVTGIKEFFSPLVEFFSGVWENIKSVFSTAITAIGDTLSGAIKGAINGVLNFVGGIINGVISGINAAISVINAIPGVSISKITELNIPQLATGGIIDHPTTALIGEAGTEAVVPLENNTGWLGKLAVMLTNEISKVKATNIVPTNNVTNNSQTTNAGGESQYMTSTTNNNQTTSGDTDNSVTFAEGAIQLTVQNASEEEAMRMAKKIMEYIKRQKELEGMAQYA